MTRAAEEVQETSETTATTDMEAGSSAEAPTQSAMDADEFEYSAVKADYYKRKLRFTGADAPQQLSTLVARYMTTIQWVLDYYYNGVSSWSWFFPYHYAPLASGAHSAVCARAPVCAHRSPRVCVKTCVTWRTLFCLCNSTSPSCHSSSCLPCCRR